MSSLRGAFYILLGPLPKTSFQRVCFKAKLFEYIGCVGTLRRCRRDLDGSFWKKAWIKAPTAVPDLREAPLRCSYNGMENGPATWRWGRKMMSKPKFLRYISYSRPTFSGREPCTFGNLGYLCKLQTLITPTTSNTPTLGLIHGKCYTCYHASTLRTPA